MILLQGENGQGKSNLLETVHVLAIAKSTRTSTDRELVRNQAVSDHIHAQVSAVVQRNKEHIRVQIDFTPTLQSRTNDKRKEANPLQKSARINGAPRRVSDLVGEINAVMFSADDLEIILGAPSIRRRYLNILLSQLKTDYLKTLQRYQRVLYQRNHLLKSVREGHAQVSELMFWNDELINSGKQIMSSRALTIATLSDTSKPIHGELTNNGEELTLVYHPGVEGIATFSEEEIDAAMRASVEEHRDQEIAQGFTICGPHRDDVQILLDNTDTAMYASRGQCRTVVLAMKLAEATHLHEKRGDGPILLLDDVLSELDAPRRTQVLDRASQYEQCFITTADEGLISRDYLLRMTRFTITNGHVERVG